jgi:hypothetical protein
LWSWIAPRGRSGGILLGLNLDCFNIDQIIHGNFFIKFKLQNICDNFTWIFIEVYGPAQKEGKYSFLQELTQACNTETSPILIGGDFNIIRNRREKNNDRYEDRWLFLFNAVINSLNLRKLELSGRQYTWTNNLQMPTYEKLDRILLSTDWELKYPKVSVHALTREIFGHSPLLLDSEQPPKQNNANMFKFELSWLLKKGFYEVVAQVWQREIRGATSLEKWQNKIKNLRKYLRGWAKNASGTY